MGFFSSISGLLGGASSGKSGGSSVSGFGALPKELQAPYLQYGNQLNTQFKDPAANNAMYTPMAQTGDETQAFNMARAGLINPEQFNQDIAMQMNPFDEYVVNDINRQSQGQNSLVNQAATQAGQQGSNRSFLGSSDVEQNRLNSIGTFRQGQYNTAVNNALGPLANMRQTDIENLLGVGAFQRGLDTQTKQAPINALQGYGNLLGPIGAAAGSQQSNTSTQQGESGGLGGLIKTGVSLAGLFPSDRNLKENIVPVGEKNGFKLYEFNYKGDHKKYRGVMAQEILDVIPDAVEEVDGFLAVDYGKLGFDMEEVNG